MIKEFFLTAFDRVLEMVLAPYYYPDMGWIVAPLVVALLIMTFYFGLYSDEELGWNTAVGNTMALVFVGADLSKTLYHLTPHASLWNMIAMNPLKVLVIILVIVEGFTLLFSNFLHALPKRLSFFVSSALPVNLTAYVAIVLVYTNLVIDRYTFVAALLLFFALLGLFSILQKTEHLFYEVFHLHKVRLAHEKRKR